jgi:hypothetical protein
MIKNASKHNIDLLVIDYADLVVNSNTEAWQKFAEFTNSDYQVSELVKLGADYHKANINLIKEICPNIQEKLKYLLT